MKTKRNCIFVVALLFAGLAPQSRVMAEEVTPQATAVEGEVYIARNSGLSFALGYCFLTGGDNKEFKHNTHDDDWFLENSNVPGSAGTTGGDMFHFLEGDVRYDWQLGNWDFNVSMGVLVGLNEDNHQNDNDPRPEEVGAFVYSSIPYGGFVGAGVDYHFGKGFSVGMKGRLYGLYKERGWDRWGKNEIDESETDAFAAACLSFGFDFSDNTNATLTGIFGGDYNGVELSFTYKF